MTTAPPSPATRVSVPLILLLGALSATAPLAIDMYLPALPQLGRDLSTGPAQVQLTLTACVVGLAAGQVIAGPLSDTFGRRRPLLIGMTAYSIASLLCMAAPTIETFIALRLVQGATGAAGIVIARTIVRDLYEGPAAARFFSVLMLVGGLAPILAPVLGGQLLRITPWPGVFGGLAAIGLVLVAGAAFGLRETLPPDRRHTGGVRATLRTFRSLAGDRVFAGYAFTAALSFSAMFVYIAGSPFVLQDVYGLSPQAFSAVFAGNAIGLVAMSQLGGRLAGRVPLRRLLAAGLLTVTAGGVALPVAVLTGAGPAAVLPALFLVVAGQGLVMPNTTALALSGRPPRVAGSASALLGLAQFALGGAAAPLAGVAGPRSAVPMAVAICGCALAAVATMALATRERRA